jgi:hypothetical protein
MIRSSVDVGSMRLLSALSNSSAHVVDVCTLVDVKADMHSLAIMQCCPV